ncbi:MAG: SHOCT domain-containing protein [Dehalococcoidales bacterium]|nr:SHOCT domain-containing protein [Dehalococcoidales bacterium]
MWYMHDVSGWWMVVGGIGMLIFWGGLAALIIWGIKKFSRHDSRSQSPLDIARERYSRGEISKEEFDQIKKDL